MIRWQDHRDRVERAVQMLIRDLHPDAQGIDGSGGDLGRDIRWNSPEGLVIFEVKSYTDLLARSQKAGIKRSLQNAARHAPVRWILIIPKNPTPAEEQWFDGLRANYPSITLEWRGRDWLDRQFASREGLIRYVEGPLYVLGERARELGHEQATMANGIADAIERLGVFTNRLDELSPFWRVDIETDRAGYTLTYSEKFPGAAAFDPITLSPKFSFPPDDPDAEQLATLLQQVLDFGGDISIPQTYIDQFDIEASAETKRLFQMPEGFETASVDIRSIEDNAGLPVPCRITVRSPNGSTAATLEIMLVRRVGGNRGVTISGSDPSGMLTVHFLLAQSEQGVLAGSWNFEVSSAIGKIPAAVRAVADFLNALQAGNTVDFHFGYAPFGSSTIEFNLIEPGNASVALIVAFDELQRHFQQVFPIPDGLGPYDLLELQALVELTQTGVTRWPHRTMKASIYAAKLEEFLARPDLRDAGAVLLRFEYFAMEFGGHRFSLGAVQFYSPAMRLVNRGELEQAVGTGLDPEGRWTCLDGEHLMMRLLVGSDAN